MREIYPPLDTSGARLFGGRFNPPGVPALYLASDPELALLESTRSAQWASFKPFGPRRGVCVNVRLSCVVDLSDVGSLQATGLCTADLRESWAEQATPTSSQVFGESALLRGIEGIIYPSAIDPARLNLVVFPDNLVEGSSIEVVEEDAG